MRRLPSSWDRTMAKLGFRRAARTSVARTHGCGTKLRGELLEKRNLLAVLNVTGTLDDCAADEVLTLREAVTVLNAISTSPADLDNFYFSFPDSSISRKLTYEEKQLIDTDAEDFGTNDQIKFDGVSGEILLQLGDFNLSKDVRIIGPGPDLLTINAQSESRIFFGGGANVAISGLRLINGYETPSWTPQYGISGAIDLSGGQFTLANLEFAGNFATRGGAVSIGVSGSQQSAIIENCRFDNNSAAFHGGALYIGTTEGASCIVRDCYFIDNEVPGSGGAIAVWSGMGFDGGHSTMGDVTIEDSVFVNNSAGETGGGIYLHLYAWGSLESEVVNIAVLRNSINANKAGVSGGGIAIDTFAAPDFGVTSVEIDGCTIYENEAFGGELYGDAEGGGGLALVRNEEVFEISLVNSTISGNKAESGGGLLLDGAIDVRHSTIAFNESGGLYREREAYYDLCDSDPGQDGWMYETVGGGGVLIRNASSTRPLPTFSHSIVARNIDHLEEPDDRPDRSAPNIAVHYSQAGWPEDYVVYTIYGDACPDPVFLADLCLSNTLPPASWPFTTQDWEELQDEYYLTLEFAYSIIDDRDGPLLQCGLDPRFGKLMAFADATYRTVSQYSGDPELDPLILPLRYNGGFRLPDGSGIKTHALPSGSTAIDAGNPAFAGPPTNDQRSAPFVRVYDGDGNSVAIIDIGAFEKQPIPLEAFDADFNENGVVDGNDFLIWQRGYGIESGATHAMGDADFDGDVDSADLAIWKDQFGLGMLTVPNADFNNDGHVDGDDFIVWNASFGMSTGGTLALGDADGDGDVDSFDFLAWQIGASNEIGGGYWNGGLPQFGQLASGTILVSTLEDEDDGDYRLGKLSLREAISLVSQISGVTDIVFFSGLTGTIELTLGAITIVDDVIITGPGADKLTIDAGGLSRVFHVNTGVEATISGLTITGGSVTASSPGGNVGGGVLNQGDLTLHSVVIVGNQTDYANLSGVNRGGGVHSTGGNLQIVNSTVDGNRSRYGGGISINVDAGKALEITGSTISNNLALSSSDDGAGGGIYLNGASTSVAEIVNSTVSGNRASNGAAIYVGASTTTLTIVNATIADNQTKNAAGSLISGAIAAGINNYVAASVTLQNTILADNVATNASWHNGIGTLAGTGSSHNLIDIDYSGLGISHGPTTTGNKVGTGSRLATLLAPLGDYGGKTKTHALKVGSPALDAGKGSLTDAQDQRGYAREYDLSVADGIDGYRDIGAYEAGEGTTLIVRSDGDRNDSIGLKATTDSLRLREALALSAALAGDEVVRFDKTGWTDDTISLSSTWAHLAISSNVNIEGPGHDELIISGGGHSTVLAIASSVVNISGVTITDGYTSSGGTGAVAIGNSDVIFDAVVVKNSIGIDGYGGVAITGGSLTLRNSTVDDNSGWYGGLYASNADLTVLNSTISNNYGVAFSGGIWFAGSGDLKILNSTISGNLGYEAGGVYTSGSGDNEIINSTIYDNVTIYETWYGGTLLPGGLRVAGAADVLIHNTIIAGNRLNDNAPRDVLVDSGSGASIISTSSYNFIGLDSGSYFSPTYGNIRGTSSAIDARLAPLADNGGPTKTHVPYYDSDVIDAGDDDIADLWNLEFDQRGYDRDEDNSWGTGDSVDIGAVELAFGEYYS